TWLGWLGLALPLLAVLAALAAGQAHAWGWMAYGAGFGVLRWALLAAGLGAVAAIVALVQAARGRGGWQWPALGLLLALALVAVPGYYVLWVLPHTARIHDITTDAAHPPEFAAILPLRAHSPDPGQYGGPALMEQQQKFYPDIAPLLASQPPAQVFPAALAVAQSMGLEIVAAQESAGRIEASARSRFFGFVDDLVVRIAPEGPGSRVDVRSSSREGRSDFGVNADRVRRFLGALKARLAG
ncbi:MAG TPA: DUF1499 domain-containing protein, partial [bacterium]|nr:DUF1499 domain-containing protein [bacterium]